MDEIESEDRGMRRQRKKEQKAGVTKPREPAEDDCCNTGCEAKCVLSIYYQLLEEYEEIMMITSSPSSSDSEG